MHSNSSLAYSSSVALVLCWGLCKKLRFFVGHQLEALGVEVVLLLIVVAIAVVVVSRMVVANEAIGGWRRVAGIGLWICNH